MLRSAAPNLAADKIAVDNSRWASSEFDTVTLEGNRVTGAFTKMISKIGPAAAIALVAWVALPATAGADRLPNQVAVFAALDKVTARISKLEIPLNQTVKFGSLKVTPRVCYSRPPTEPPKTTTFVEVDEVQLDGQEKRIFTGWMLAESPGLNAVEHPVFDVWLTNCDKPTRVEAARDAKEAPAAKEDPAADPFRRRVRR